MSREPTSFSRIFGGGSSADEGDDTPSVHVLYSAHMRGELALPQFREALRCLHNIRLPPAAERLLQSVDAASGRMPFSQFQKSLGNEGVILGQQAGRPNVFTDQAKAIIEDNLGAPSAPSRAAPAKHSTDISADVYVRQQTRLDKAQARGPFNSNPVMRTNKPSGANPLIALRREEAERSSASQDPSDPRELAYAATRMFISGDLDRSGYEDLAQRLGADLSPESELQRLILKQDRTGDCKFTDLARALQTRRDAEAERRRQLMRAPQHPTPRHRSIGLAC